MLVISLVEIEHLEEKWKNIFVEVENIAELISYFHLIYISPNNIYYDYKNSYEVGGSFKFVRILLAPLEQKKILGGCEKLFGHIMSVRLRISLNSCINVFEKDLCRMQTLFAYVIHT